MDPVILMLLALIVLIALLRLRSTYRKARRADKSEHIQQRLAELRRRREEDNQ